MIAKDIKRVKERLAKGREILLAGHLDSTDYKRIQAKGEEKLRRLDAGLADDL